jgi:hypothetical protein
MMRRLPLLLLIALAWSGCGDTVHIRLSGDPACMAAATAVKSFYAELEQTGQGLTFKKCSDAPNAAFGSLADLETFLAGSIIFNDVPSGGSWTIWVQGFPSTDCEKKKGTPLICGTEEEVVLPSAGDELSINVNCVPPGGLWSADALGTCRFP